MAVEFLITSRVTLNSSCAWMLPRVCWSSRSSIIWIVILISLELGAAEQESKKIEKTMMILMMFSWSCISTILTILTILVRVRVDGDRVDIG